MRSGILIEALEAGYDSVPVLKHISLELPQGDSLALIGRNGAGKTSFMKALMGLIPLSAGRIIVNGQALERLPPHRRVAAGLSYVPQGREIFTSLSVMENLLVSARPGGNTPREAFDLFPVLEARRDYRAGLLSGGEQQMLAIARALVNAPHILLLDEPLEGIAPVYVKKLLEALREIRRTSDLTIIVAEQRPVLAKAFASRIAVIDRGEIISNPPSGGG